MPQRKNEPGNQEISFIETPTNDEISIPEQKEYFALPARFGAVPIDEAPLGWETETRRHETKITRFQHIYPTIRLPFQEVQRVEFGHNAQFLKENEDNPKLKQLFPTGANRLFFGDNLHVMRQLPSESVDLIYIDPPFFSGRNYNVIFGDKNESRSFTDIWEGGMPGYLVWINARLFEMKRLLKPTGSIFVHLDWHAVHYVKVEMDKIFGVDNFRNEIIWCYTGPGSPKMGQFNRKHDNILWYSKSTEYAFYRDVVRSEHAQKTKENFKNGLVGSGFLSDTYDLPSGKVPEDWWPMDKPLEESIDELFDAANANQPGDWWEIAIAQRYPKGSLSHIGYPTEKPYKLVQRIVEATTEKGDVMADFFCGGGVTPMVAQEMDRRWVSVDQSRIAVAITADRVNKVVREKIGNLFPVPDFTVEHWGIYEAPRLEHYPENQFREFVVKAFGGRPENITKAIHGIRYGIPLYVGEPSRQTRITKNDVAAFAKAVYEERHANHGVILGWNFSQDARQAAEILAARENKRIDFVRLNLIRIEDEAFREHIVNKSQDYASLLSFIQPPEIRVKYQRLDSRKYLFDVSESVSLNKDGLIANVQWDFNHKLGRFISTQGYSFLRDKKTGQPILIVEYVFPDEREYIIACSVQDDQGGERTIIMKVEVN